MFERIERFATKIGNSNDFRCSYQRGSSSAEADVLKLQMLLGRHFVDVPNLLLDLYRSHNELSFRWSYKKLTHPDYRTFGSTSLSRLSFILRTLETLPDALLPFDTVSDSVQIRWRLTGGGISLIYFDLGACTEFPLALNPDQYLRLLDECRGLYPWRELFIRSPAFKLDQVLVNKFFEDLAFLFPDARAELFATP